MDEIEEKLSQLYEMESEYQWTQSPELKLLMCQTAREINDMLLEHREIDLTFKRELWLILKMWN